jgi:hypothetical protein
VRPSRSWPARAPGGCSNGPSTPRSTLTSAAAATTASTTTGRDSALYLVFKITQRLELVWRPLNGGLTIMTLLLRGARFVDGIYIPADVERADDPGEEVSAV